MWWLKIGEKNGGKNLRIGLFPLQTDIYRWLISAYRGLNKGLISIIRGLYMFHGYMI
jgi:hypothetical protein